MLFEFIHVSKTHLHKLYKSRWRCSNNTLHRTFCWSSHEYME